MTSASNSDLVLVLGSGMGKDGLKQMQLAGSDVLAIDLLLEVPRFAGTFIVEEVDQMMVVWLGVASDEKTVRAVILLDVHWTIEV